MFKRSISNLKDDLHGSLRDLALWLALAVLLLGSLYFFGSLALVWPRYDQATDTRSRLLADYKAWLYDTIPAINIEALVKDIITDQKRAGTVEPTVVKGVFLVPPTPTFSGTLTVTATPARTPTLLSTQAPAPTQTSLPTSTQVPPSATPLKTATSTRTPFIPTITNTPQPQNTATKPPPTAIPPTSTPTRKPPTATATAAATFTAVPPSATPLPTSARTPTLTPPPVIPTATPAIVHPIAENDGLSAPQGSGCLASFGYLNDNPQPVDIPAGGSNYLSPNISPAPQVTHFLVGRMYDVFQVAWNAPGDLVWNLDGQTATVKWCKP